MDKEVMYKKAIIAWGVPAQLLTVVEELNELAVEVCHKIRGRLNLSKIVDEIADVEIMLDQLKYIYRLYESVEDQKIEKLKRLEERLAEI